MREGQNGCERYDAAAREAAGVLGTLRLAGSLLESRRPIDLQGLDDLVGRLCARALDLPPDQGRRLRPRLTCVAAALDQLVAATEASRQPAE